MSGVSSTPPNGHEPTSMALTLARERPTVPKKARKRTDRHGPIIDPGLSKRAERIEFRLDGFENGFKIKNQETDNRFEKSKDEVNRLTSAVLSQGKLLDMLSKDLYLLRGDMRNKRTEMGLMERSNQAMVKDVSTVRRGMAAMEADFLQYRKYVREQKAGMVMVKADMLILQTDLINIKLDMVIMKKEMEAYIVKLFDRLRAEL